MKIKTFHGRDMAEALASVKKQFGRHAVILGTRTRMRGGLFGIGSHSHVEITAARDIDDLPASLRTSALAAPLRGTGVPPGAARRAAPTPGVRTTSSSDTLLTEMTALKSMVAELVQDTRRDRSLGQSEALHSAYRDLIENAVAEEVANELVTFVRASLPESKLGDPRLVRAALAEAVGRMVPSAGGIQWERSDAPRVIALVGPTGVGKTTTVAKLAANLALRDKRKVGLITIDTYRIAAVEQLRTYSQIMEVPLKVAMRPEQYADCISSLSDRDVIIVDTAGRSQKDAVKIDELCAFFDAARPDETHLVLSSTCSERVLLDTVERFAALNADRVIFTKLDEAVGFGVVLRCLQRAKARLSYVTTGQDVPDDIEVGRPEELARLILGQQVESREAVALVS